MVGQTIYRLVRNVLSGYGTSVCKRAFAASGRLHPRRKPGLEGPLCGILAIVGDTDAYRTSPSVANALDRLAQRGPDDRGVLHFEGCSLAHTRLSITDIERGAQPMWDEERDTAVSFNGQIYNFPELKRDLQDKGHRFSARSDTEVILKAYAEYGEDCVFRFDGMFSFAVWDNRERTLFIARDRFGEKPLYYARDDRGNVLFASEIKALHALGVSGRIDISAIDHYLLFKYPPRNRTIYSNIYVVPPAHRATVRGRDVTPRKYWELRNETTSLSFRDAQEAAEHLIREAVRKCLVGDVEIGAFLSGGVDSTIVTAYAHDCLEAPMATFSVSYGDTIDESPFAREVSRRFDTRHSGLRISDDFLDELEKTIGYFDEPHADTSNLAQQMLSSLASEHVKVALSGDGADELFLGYDWYRNPAQRTVTAYSSGGVETNSFEDFMQRISIFPDPIRRTLLGTHGRPRSVPIGERLSTEFPTDIERMNYFDIFHYLSGQILRKVDQAGMMHGLEVRCPFLDHHLAQFAYSLPTEYKISPSAGKIILKNLVRQFMPGAFADRRKQGFGAPVRKWVERPEIRDYIAGRLGPGARIFDYLSRRDVLKAAENAYASGTPKGAYQIWVLLCLEIWLSTRGTGEVDVRRT